MPGCGAYGVLADDFALVRADVAEAQGEHGADAQSLAFYASSRRPLLRAKELSVDTGTRRVHYLDELAGALRRGLVGVGVLGPRLLVPQHVPLLVQHRLQVALPAVAEHEAPVGRLVSRRSGRGQLAQQRDHRRPIGEAPERLGDQRPQAAACVIPDARPATETARRENRWRAEGEVGQQLRQIRRTPAESPGIGREQIVDVRTEEVRIGLRQPPPGRVVGARNDRESTPPALHVLQ